MTMRSRIRYMALSDRSFAQLHASHRVAQVLDQPSLILSLSS